MQAGMKKTIAFLTPQKLLMASKIIFEIIETKKTKKKQPLVILLSSPDALLAMQWTWCSCLEAVQPQCG